MNNLNNKLSRNTTIDLNIPSKPKKKNVTYRLKESNIKFVEAYSNEKNMSKSELIDAMIEVFKKQENR